VKDNLERVVQWYPGHMARAMRRLGEYVKLIDIVIEVIDARAVRSDANPMLNRLVGDRSRIVALSREDLADPMTTKRWVAAFAERGREALAVEARSQQSVSRILAAVKAKAKLRRGMSRVMVVGVPNSGKSSIINGLLRRGAAKIEDRAGVTRALQWFRLASNIELMDTPGILVPKIATAQAQWKLALIGAVPRDHYDPVEVSTEFYHWHERRTGAKTKVPDLATFAAERGFVRRGGEYDEHNAAQSYIKAFNDGVFGRISLEAPGEDDEQAA